MKQTLKKSGKILKQKTLLFILAFLLNKRSKLWGAKKWEKPVSLNDAWRPNISVLRHDSLRDLISKKQTVYDRIPWSNHQDAYLNCKQCVLMLVKTNLLLMFEFVGQRNTQWVYSKIRCGCVRVWNIGTCKRFNSHSSQTILNGHEISTK